MAKAFAKYNIADVAARLVEKNPQLATIVANHPGASYKALEAHVSTKTVANIGRQTGQYIQRNKLIWAIINHVDGTNEDLDF